MPFLPPNQQRHSTEGTIAVEIYRVRRLQFAGQTSRVVDACRSNKHSTAFVLANIARAATAKT